MNNVDIERIEIDLLLEALFQAHGYDFRSYARRRWRAGYRTFSPSPGMGIYQNSYPQALHDRAFFSRLVQHFSIAVTEMFRDPFVYRTLREQVIPRLHSYPHAKIWCAGCATGEEVYSLAILLKEEELLERTTLYATDFNEDALEQAGQGIFPLSRMKLYTANYQKAGGKNSFSDYYRADYNSAVMNDALKRQITFASHNLTADGVFGEMQLVICRNVLIYFNQELQNRALKLFTDSLVHGGFLCLGTAESLAFSAVAENYKEVDKEARLYKRI